MENTLRKIEVLGPGCTRCKETFRVVAHVVETERLPFTVENALCTSSAFLYAPALYPMISRASSSNRMQMYAHFAPTRTYVKSLTT